LLLAGMGCSDGVTPALHNLVYKGQAPDSTVVLLLEVDFDDPDGDLGEGFLEVFIDGQSTSLGLLDLSPIFVRNAVDTDATSGTLAIPLELALEEDTLPPSGTTFSVGFRATDAADHTSAEVSTFLKLTY